MAVGTTDKNNEEILGVFIRFIDMILFEIEEREINVGNSGRSASEIFQFIKKHFFDDTKISFDGMVSKSFDGASVMSGKHGGLQAIICQFCGRNKNLRCMLCYHLRMPSLLQLILMPLKGHLRKQ